MRELTTTELGIVCGGMPNNSFYMHVNLPANPAGIQSQTVNNMATNGLFGTPIGPVTRGPYSGCPTGTFMAPVPPRQPTPFEFFQLMNGTPRQP
jgi:hypothetical protein